MREARGRLTATLCSAKEPTAQQVQRFEAFLARTDRKSTRLNSSHI